MGPFSSGVPSIDSDHDGTPLWLRTLNRLNRHDASDGAQALDSDG